MILANYLHYLQQIQREDHSNMKNNSVSDFVAQAMDAVLKSEQHKALFKTQYKTASAECKEHGKVDDCDSMSADDNDARRKKKMEEDEDKKGDCDSADAPTSNLPAGQKPLPLPADPTQKLAPSPGVQYADDMFADDNDARRKKKEKEEEEKDEDSADDYMSSSAFDVAIDSLLTASAALDVVGMEKSSSLSLKLAALVVEAKKKDPKAAAKEKAEKEKAAKLKAKEKAAKEKEKAKLDMQSAKDKAVKAKEKEKAAKEKEAKEAKEKAAKEKEKAAKEKASKK
jgi:hypothetical protein